MTAETPPSDHDALQPGTRLGEFEIQRVLGIGGFGIVYLAFDHALERQVALKEYMPSALASRGQGASVSIRSTSHVETFGVGLRSFVNEAKLLARFDHPSLVKVYRFWEDNGTAYMVMPYYQGQTLRDARKSMPQPPDEAWLRGLLEPLLGALEVLHREQVYHRDIAPDNILLLASGQPVLLDFGAARRVIGDRTQTLTAILKPNFAPIEQYAESVALRQGPWTDLYALGAVVHYCLTGKPPMPAAARAVHDEMPSVRSVADTLASQFKLHYGEAFVSSIDACLAVRPQGRPDSVAALRALLRGDHAYAATQPAASAGAYAPTQPHAPAAESATQAYAATVRQEPAPPAPVPAPVRRRPAVMAGAAAAAVVLAGVLWYAGSRPHGHGEAAVAAAVSAPPVAAASMSEPPASALVAAAAAPLEVLEAAASAAAVKVQAGELHAAASAVPAQRAKPRAEPPSATRHTSVAEASKPAQHQPETPAVAAATPVAPPADPGPGSPREACGKRVFLAMYFCMKEQCEKPAFARHPQCAELARKEEANRERTEQR